MRFVLCRALYADISTYYPAIIMFTNRTTSSKDIGG